MSPRIIFYYSHKRRRYFCQEQIHLLFNYVVTYERTRLCRRNMESTKADFMEFRRWLRSRLIVRRFVPIEFVAINYCSPSRQFNGRVPLSRKYNAAIIYILHGCCFNKLNNNVRYQNRGEVLRARITITNLLTVFPIQ